MILSVQRTTQTSLRSFLQTRIMVDGAKFNSQDSGGHLKSRLLKMAAARKIHSIFVIKLKLQVRLRMQSLHRYTLLMV